ncbi:MAG: hypothetical protein ACK40L_19325, partial [Hydrogenophaga sp.]
MVPSFALSAARAGSDIGKSERVEHYSGNRCASRHSATVAAAACGKVLKITLTLAPPPPALACGGVETAGR